MREDRGPRETKVRVVRGPAIDPAESYFRGRMISGIVMLLFVAILTVGAIVYLSIAYLLSAMRGANTLQVGPAEPIIIGIALISMTLAIVITRRIVRRDRAD